MPYEWVYPKEFMNSEEAGGTVVYHCHKKGCLMVYHYQIFDEDGWMAFDIRDLADETGLSTSDTGAEHKNIVKLALAGLAMPLKEILKETEIWYEGETE